MVAKFLGIVFANPIWLQVSPPTNSGPIHAIRADEFADQAGKWTVAGRSLSIPARSGKMPPDGSIFAQVQRNP
jgi:hypothetical protein